MLRLRLPSLTVLPALLALVLAGCGGSATEGTTTAPAENPGAPSETGQGSGEKNLVTMEGLEYKPSKLTVKVGETVKWRNDESIQHDVFAEGTPGLKSELFGEGGTYTYKPTKAGTIAYVCTIHPGMEGTLEVE